jgi:DNA modification methylase
MEPESVDAIVTDPPYGLEFMGKSWDRLGDVAHANRGTLTNMVTERGTPKFRTKAPAFDLNSASQRGMQTWHEAWAREALRVAKPGAYLLAFGGTRTVHRLACAIEDAGWIIRDTLVWAYAQGFPKSKASLKPAWEPIVMARKPGPLRELAIGACRIPTDGERIGGGASGSSGFAVGYQRGDGFAESALGRWPANVILTDPIFDGGIEGVVGGGETAGGTNVSTRRSHVPGVVFSGAEEHAETGYGDTGTYSRFFMLPRDGRSDAPSGRMGTCRTCGAPIAEPTSTARTPRPDTAPQNVVTRPLAPGDQLAFDAASPSPSPETATARSHAVTPPDGMPVSTASEADPATASDTSGTTRSTSLEPTPDTAFRSDQPARTAEQPPISTGTTTTTADLLTCERCADDVIHGRTLPQRKPTRPALPVDGDDYTRFLILPKADRADREPVLGGLPLRRTGTMQDDAYRWERDGKGNAINLRTERENTHPTVKPTELMRHLVRLVTPTGGVVLDPFAGSGSTLIAAEMEGFAWIGIEKEAEYVAIAEARLNGTQRGLGLSA